MVIYIYITFFGGCDFFVGICFSDFFGVDMLIFWRVLFDVCVKKKRHSFFQQKNLEEC